MIHRIPKYFTLIGITGILLYFTSCLDTIDVPLPAAFENALVVQGGLVRNGDKATVQVLFRLASDERGQSSVIRVQKANVFNDLNQQLELTLDLDGYYKVSVADTSAFNINYGRTFYIKVTTNDGQQYESVPVVLYPSPAISSLTWKKLKKPFVNALNKPDSADFIEFYLNTTALTSPGFLKFDIINSFKYSDQLDGKPPVKTCYVTQRADVKNVLLLDIRNTTSADINNVAVYDHKLDYIFSEGYYVTVVQQAIDQLSFDYYSEINALNNRDGSIYDAPAGRISTNIYNTSESGKKAYGYFYAVAQDTARVYISPEQVGNPSRQCPVLPSETSPCPVKACCDCLILNGASLNKPDFWN